MKRPKISLIGSGNIGATNVTRVLGLGAGALVLVLDTAKGAFTVWLASRSCGDWIVAAAGFAAIGWWRFDPARPKLGRSK